MYAIRSYYADKLRTVLNQKNDILTKIYGQSALDYDTMLGEFMGYRKKLAPYICDTVSLCHSLYAKNRNMLFEGAQGMLLDIDFGTYPFVTRNNFV